MVSSLPTYSVFISLSSEKEQNINQNQKTRAIGSLEQKNSVLKKVSSAC